MTKAIQIVLSLTLCVAFAFYGNAQSKNNQKENALNKVNEANKKVISNPESAFSLALRAVEISKADKDRKAEASAYNTLGTLFYNSGKYQKAIDYFTKAKNIYATVKDAKNEEYALKYLAKSHEALGRNDLSISYNNQAERKALSDSAKTGYRLYNSKIKKKQGKKQEAIKDLELELKNNTRLSKKEKIDIYLELGDLYISEKDTVRGFQLIDQALLQSSQGTTDTTTIATLNSASSIYESHGWTAKNIQTQGTYENLAATNNDVALQSAASINLGNAYLNANDYSKAIEKFEFTNSTIDTLATIKLDPNAAISITQDEIEAAEKLSLAYEKSGQYDKALKAYKRYVIMVDSVKEANIKGKYSNELLSAKYQIQESRIEDLEARQKEREASIKRQKGMIVGLLIGLAVLLLLTYFLVKNIRQKQKSNSLIRLASLRSQMNPHFIFNSLNSVNRFISENDEVKANSYLADFSKLMRSVLNNSNKDAVTLAEELKTLQIYLSLEHSRFEDRFNYEIEVDAKIDSQEIAIPTMLIQPYIENAIWHGLRYTEKEGFLRLRIKQKNQHLEVEIEDNGIGRAESQRLKTNHQKDYTSTGISNTKERIALLNKLYHTQLKVDIEDLNESGEATGTRVTLQIPILQQEEYA